MSKRKYFQLFVAMGLLSISVTAHSLQKEQGKRTIDPTKSKNVVDVRPMIKGKQLKSGLNPIHTNASGLKISANVKGGEIIGFVIYGKDGKELPSAVYKTATNCWECAIDSKGDTHCWKVPCPQGPFTPWPGATKVQ